MNEFVYRLCTDWQFLNLILRISKTIFNRIIYVALTLGNSIIYCVQFLTFIRNCQMAPRNLFLIYFYKVREKIDLV